ncbi:MAG: alpha-1,2-fucosyltransferase [Flavobacteriales bacterium]|nr:alpha-1,2-fucosyltransferase [Flavobacteriales bacterium]
MAIISKITDGLGNQLFQYALGRRLALERSVDLLADTSWYDTINPEFTPRTYLLDRFHTCLKRAAPDAVRKIESPHLLPGIRRLYYVWQARLPYYKRRVVKEQGPGFDSRVLECGSHVVLKGFWQSEKYFSSIREVLLQEIKPLHIPETLIKMAEKLENEEGSVAVHVRRGDYAKTDSEHILLDSSYYKKAIETLKSHIAEKLYFYIFSEEPVDAGIVGLPEGEIRVMPAHPQSPEWDLWLMSRCRHFIIANSSFSWWAAWLCTNAGKKVIAPARRHKNPAFDSPDFLPESWIKIDF